MSCTHNYLTHEIEKATEHQILVYYKVYHLLQMALQIQEVDDSEFLEYPFHGFPIFQDKRIT